VVTGIRLEALSSSRLPQKGPGHAGNGNFVLNEVSVSAVAESGAQPVTIGSASATYEQQGFSAEATFDGVSDQKHNGWAVMGGAGQDQAITFQLAEPLTGAGEKTLVVTLHQAYGKITRWGNSASP
jgi:hypothetical protein